MPDKKRIGIEGENLASNFLQSKGYKILHRNWRHKRLEIDIIAEIDGIVVFVEVKARKNNLYGYPELAVNESKMERLMEAAEEFMIQNKVLGEIRFDIVSITNHPDGPSIFHLTDAFSG